MKRFTETNKWNDPWFWELSPPAKLLWIFLCDNCDGAGIVEVGLKFTSMKIGMAITDSHMNELKSRLHPLPCGKIMVLGFIRFQFGTISRDCKPHNPIFLSLEKHGLSLDDLETLSKGIPKGSLTLQEKEKEKVQERDKEKEEGVKGEKYHKDSKDALKALNESSGRNFRETPTNMTFISSRLNEDGVTIEGVKLMITRQCKLWKPDPKMCEYLRPETLFNKTKFDAYYAAREIAITSQADKPNPRNAGIVTAPGTNYNVKPRWQREHEEKARLAQQVAQAEPALLPTEGGA